MQALTGPSLSTKAAAIAYLKNLGFSFILNTFDKKLSNIISHQYLFFFFFKPEVNAWGQTTKKVSTVVTLKKGLISSIKSQQDFSANALEVLYPEQASFFGIFPRDVLPMQFSFNKLWGRLHFNRDNCNVGGSDYYLLYLRSILFDDMGVLMWV